MIYQLAHDRVYRSWGFARVIHLGHMTSLLGKGCCGRSTYIRGPGRAKRTGSLRKHLSTFPIYQLQTEFIYLHHTLIREAATTGKPDIRETRVVPLVYKKLRVAKRDKLRQKRYLLQVLTEPTGIVTIMQEGLGLPAIRNTLHAIYCETTWNPKGYHHRQRKFVHLGTMETNYRKIRN